ncbi:NmrA-like family protein [Amylocystis lapponica]|nr:NmrA-like family protein [Amylocystis lapponica]
MKYVVTGATGALGSQVVKYLLRLVPASDIIVSLYNPEGASAELVASGVEIRRGDYTDPASLDAAFAGAERLLLVSYPSLDPGRAAHHVRAIDAARRAGVQHIFYTSLGFRGNSAAVVMQAHNRTEAYLRESGVRYTAIREGIYSESWSLYLGFWDRESGGDEVVIPHGDGGISWVCREDLGEGTAKIMVAESGYENRTVMLTGSRALTLGELAERVSEIVGRTLRVRVVTEDEYVGHNAGKRGGRGEEGYLRGWATTFAGLKSGELGTVDPLLESLLGREPKAVEETLREMLGRAGTTEVVDRYAK